MAPNTTPSIVERLPLHQIPRDTLFEATEDVSVDAELMLRPGQLFIVPDTTKLPAALKLALHGMNQQMPLAAFVALKTRGVITLLLLKKGALDGAGEVMTNGDEPPTQPGQKRNIAPSLISAQAVPSVSKKAGELPKNTPLYLTKNYHYCSTGDSGDFTEIPEEFNIGTTPTSDAFMIRKGQEVQISEVFDRTKRKLVLEGLGIKSGSRFPISEESILEVCVPVEKRLDILRRHS